MNAKCSLCPIVNQGTLLLSQPFSGASSTVSFPVRPVGFWKSMQKWKMLFRTAWLQTCRCRVWTILSSDKISCLKTVSLNCWVWKTLTLVSNPCASSTADEVQNDGCRTGSDKAVKVGFDNLSDKQYCDILLIKSTSPLNVKGYEMSLIPGLDLVIRRQIHAGILKNKVRKRRPFSLTSVLWSMATLRHALVRSRCRQTRPIQERYLQLDFEAQQAAFDFIKPGDPFGL